MKKYKIGLVIGRFQPFHLGHKFLIEKSLKISETIVIGIGSSNVTDNQNPYSYDRRENFLEEFIRKEGIENRIKKIVPIVDDPDDDVWLSKLKEVVGRFDVGIGDNEWVNGIFENSEIPVVKIGYFEREKLEGTKIRNLMKDKKKWEDRVPSYLISSITE